MLITTNASEPTPQEKTRNRVIQELQSALARLEMTGRVCASYTWGDPLPGAENERKNPEGLSPADAMAAFGSDATELFAHGSILILVQALVGMLGNGIPAIQVLQMVNGFLSEIPGSDNIKISPDGYTWSPNADGSVTVQGI
jgi:hypothetical protein